jgi:proton-translocating NADH-quinone oxidoreductase chain M
MFSNPLIILLMISVVSFISISIIPYKYMELIRFLGFSSSIFLFVWSLWLWVLYNEYLGTFQFLVQINQIPLLGIDGISLIFIILTTFLFVCSFLLVWSVKQYLKSLVLLLIFLELLLLLVFSVVDLFIFYIVFELILLPMVLIIFIWGSRTRKIKAGFYFFLYTLFGSLLMLIGLLLLYSEFGTCNFLLLMYLTPGYEKQLLFWFLFFFSFAIKIPMFPFHIWLPEAHVEAPTIGSVLLAGLLLKLGGYGFLRILISLFPDATLFFNPLLLTLAILGIIYASLTLLRQIDIKKIIAYSSIAHMNFALLGMFSNTLLGLQGSLYLLVSHGFSSSALFMLAGVLYEKHHTRLLHYYGGLTQLMPLYAFFFFIFTIANFGFPGTSNFVGEILIFLGLIQQSFFLVLCGGFGMLFSVIYSILLFNRILFGELKFFNLTFNFYHDLSKREFAILIFLSFFLLFFGFFPNILLDLMALPTTLLLIK